MLSCTLQPNIDIEVVAHSGFPSNRSSKGKRLKKIKTQTILQHSPQSSPLRVAPAPGAVVTWGAPYKVDGAWRLRDYLALQKGEDSRKVLGMLSPFGEGLWRIQALANGNPSIDFAQVLSTLQAVKAAIIWKTLLSSFGTLFYHWNGLFCDSCDQ